MRWTPVFAGLLLCASASSAQEAVAREVILQRMKAKMADNLGSLPNYTCTETIDRSKRRQQDGQSELVDTLRLEAALVDGKEPFSPAGAAQSAIGDGAFAQQARSLFLTSSAEFAYAREHTLNGRRAIEYHFRVPETASQYIIRTGSRQALVGYHGSIWVDIETLDLIRLEAHVDGVLLHLDLTAVSHAVEYARMKIGGTDFLLPATSELVIAGVDGVEYRNLTQFGACRQYTVGSALALTGPGDSSPAAPATDVVLLARIKAKALQNLRRQPNYTCAETIERSWRSRHTQEFQPVDTLRLEVALVDGKELYSPAGAEQFDEKPLHELVALLARNIFLTDSPEFAPAEERMLGATRALVYKFHVPPASSHFQIPSGARQARVGYHGALWADALTLDLIRLEARAEDISPSLDLAEASQAIDYGWTTIGATDFLLPETSELTMIGRDGAVKRNRARFSGCREYSAESVLSLNPPAQEPLAPEVLLLARIKAKAAENLQRLPNYTCTETIERSSRTRGARKFHVLDKLRLEVAMVAGKELFSWPGAGKFEEKPIAEIVGYGATGNGNFALHASHVFMTHWPKYAHVGETLLNGRRAIRYDYSVPQMLSTNRLRSRAASAIVGYHGSFWVEKDTLDLMRLEVHADTIPPDLNIAASTDILEYHRVRIGAADFLLPESSEMSMIDRAGSESRNRTQLSECRQYAGESVLHFGEAPPDLGAPAPELKRKPLRLPAGLTVEIQLQTPIESGRSATGDLLKAVVARDVTENGKTLAPKGAVLTGRLTRLQHGEDYYILGLDFSTIEFGDVRGEFRASLQNNGLKGSSTLALQQVIGGDEQHRTGGIMAIRGSNIFLRRGHSMVWRTEE